MPEEKNTQEGTFKETTEKLWEKTRKTFHSAAQMAGQYKRIVQKKIDLASIHKKISSTHADLGQLIDQRRPEPGKDFLASAEVKQLFDRLDELKNSAALLEHEIEVIKAEEPEPDPEEKH